MGVRCLLLALMFVGANVWAQTPANAYKNQYAKGRILVEPRTGLSEGGFGKILNKVKSLKALKLGKGKVQVIELPDSLSEAAAVALLSKDPDVKFVELDRKVRATYIPNDNYYSYQWHLPQIGLPTAWNTSEGLGVTIAILDSGIDASHPDLAANIVAGFNVYENNSNTADVCGHGTAVAGAAAGATNNGLGISGVAGRSKIMPVRIAYYDSVADGCFAYFSTIASGITYAADHGARVVNVSYADLASSAAVQSAANYLRSKGGLLFTTAGNDGINENIAPTSSMVVVSATDDMDVKASWSSYGNFVTISAPGEEILTTNMSNEYQYWTGTSFASPIVAGVAALMMSAKPGLGPDIIESLLYSTSADLGATGRDPLYGHGRVNAAAAVQAASNYTGVGSDTSLPSSQIIAPMNGSTVEGVIAVNVVATDNTGVTKVDLKVNGVLVSTVTSSPYSFSWNSKSVANGSVSLVAVAYDAAGNWKASQAVVVTVANDVTAPTVAITSPAVNAVLSGVVNVAANASDNKGVVKVDFKVGANVVATSNTAPYSFNWDTKSVVNNTYSLTAVAYDAAGNSKASTAVTVRVANDVTAPTVSIASPTAGSTIKDSVTITANASDAVGVVKVEFKLNGTLIGTDTAAPFSVVWDTKSVVNGSYSLSAVATDAAGNSKTSTAVSVNVANPGPDIVAPTVAITAPAVNAILKGSVTVSASASDAVGVTKVEFKVNGLLIGTDTASPFSTLWDTKTVANGTVSLTAVAYDAAGNSKVSTAVSVSVANDVTPPAVSITAPTAGVTVKGSVTISASASDAVGVVKVEFKVNGTLIGTDTSSPFSAVWDSKSLNLGTVNLVAVAYDAAGNSANSNVVTVNVDNRVVDVTAPTVSITSPTASATVKDSVTINANASDAVGVVRVEFKVNGTLIGADNLAPYSVVWDSKSVVNGTYSLVAVAYDAAGNSKASTAISVKVANPVPDVTAPTVVIAAPSVNATVKGNVTISASASDAVGVVKVEFKVNGVLVGTDTVAPFSVVWDTKTVANGAASLTAVAYDAAGNQKTSNPRSVNVANDVTAPVVTLTNPLPGAVVTGYVSVKATATDNLPITGTTITISINGVVVSSGTGGSRTYSWNTNAIAAGTHTIQAVAKDAAGNTSTTSVTVIKN